MLLQPVAAPSRLRRHLGVLAVILVGLLGVLDAEHSWTRDDGFYATQTHALANGGWGIDTPYAVNETAAASLEVTDGVRYAYSRHPAWPTLQGLPYDLAGSVGLRVLPLVGVLAAAGAAWALSTAIGSTRPEYGFWLTAASPVLLHGTALWAIAPAAALGAIALVAAIRAGRTGAPIVWSLLLVASVAAAVLMRSEGAIVAVAIALSAWITNDRGRRMHVALAALGAGGCAHALETRWIDSIVEDGAVGGAVARTFDGGSRLGAAATSLWSGGYADALGSLLGLASLLSVCAAVWLMRRSASSSIRMVSLLLTVAPLLLIVRAMVASDDVVPGLFAAWPVVVLALGRKQRLGTDERFLLAFSALAACAVLATQYSDGGGLQWGGRFFAILIVPLAVVAAPRLVGLVEAHPELRVRVVVLAIAPMLVGCLAVVQLQSAHRNDIAAVTAHDPDVVLSARGALPNLAWSDANEAGRVWLHVLPEDLGFVVEQLGGVDAAVIGYSAAELVVFAEHPRAPLGNGVLLVQID